MSHCKAVIVQVLLASSAYNSLDIASIHQESFTTWVYDCGSTVVLMVKMRCLVLGDAILGIVVVLVDFLYGLGRGVVGSVELFCSIWMLLFVSFGGMVFGVVFVGKAVFVSACVDEIDEDVVGNVKSDGVAVRIGEDLLGFWYPSKTEENDLAANLSDMC
ncbi:hypothetical protein Tco_0062542, partial [Tanacetum coccineum]